ncbi:MAG: hypothetical protein NTZ56_22585 [Acidobacteria bacterium]|nr:hypothetical protein [Acidobacteriota bacterium]
MRSLIGLLAVCASAQTVLWEKQAPVQSGALALPGLRAGEVYRLVVSVDQPDLLGSARFTADLNGVSSKTLHRGDADFSLTFAATAQPALRLTLEGQPARRGRYSVRVLPVPGEATLVEREPNNSWQQANPIRLGDLISASADDTPYVPLPGAARSLGNEGVDWYRVEFTGAPKLVFFQLELIERDNIPVDVSVWRVVNGKEVPYSEGEDPVALPHEVQALPGNKFTTRILKDPGAYYVRVAANHPSYQLRTRVYDPPPYAKPELAVRTALDFLLGAGDSWHANTPRRGGVWDRVANVHQETSLCVACHPTHFTQRAALYAARNGYPVHQRQQLDFLAERFYNNPRPLFGFEQPQAGREAGAVWARVISAPANVLGRMSHLLDLYEKQVSGVRREPYHASIREFLHLYYNGRTKLPPDETNGNLPLVSAYEVAWYAWEATHDATLEPLIVQDSGIKNVIDLCYQTQALAAMDRQKHAAKIAANAERLLSLQRESGQWSMKFDPKEKEVEFQTGHVLWALHAAGIPREHPQVTKGLNYLLSRQQPWGGWLDPLQSFENFRTPFRETQMAVLALSAYYPGGEKQQPDAVTPFDLPAAISRLGSPSKIDQRQAAFEIRLNYSRDPKLPSAPLLKALAGTEREKWGATRVFATHFSALAQRAEFADALIRLTTDASPVIRMQAIKGLWQFWFWTPSAEVKGRIEDAVLAGLKVPQNPWVETNLREAIYNLADENIRYLYNNWVPSLANAADQERVIRGRLAIEARQADKFATFLEKENDANRKRLLAALTEFPLRRADIYDEKADHTATAPFVYNRIGNDIEQIVFFGDSATRFSRALLPLMDSPDPEMKRLTQGAALMVRDANFGGPAKISGTPGPERTQVLAKLPPPPPRPKATTTAEAGKPVFRGERPDESYFRGYVQPILEARGKDGYACVHCHATHTIFNGTPATAMNVVDLENPENSLILRKPTSSAEEEGTLAVQSGGAKVSHGGGVRWEKGSPEYNAILNWIRGAKP